jgi:histidinol-phosphatase (PHP family)
MAERLLYETHSHTPLCKHASGQPEDYAEAAYARGLRGLVVTCHNPMPDGFSANVRMDVDQMDQYIDMVARARAIWANKLDVRLGLEADYFAGYESWLQRQLSSADFHYVLGSVHPHVKEFKQHYWNDDPVELQRTYFRLLADAAETDLFDSISHPDLIKNLTAKYWEPTKIMGDICRALDRIAATGVAMELNTSGANKAVAQMNPFPEMLMEMHARGIPVTVGADAHDPDRVGDRFEQALELLARCGYSHCCYFVERQRHDVPIVEALASLSVSQITGS